MNTAVFHLRMTFSARKALERELIMEHNEQSANPWFLMNTAVSHLNVIFQQGMHQEESWQPQHVKCKGFNTPKAVSAMGSHLPVTASDHNYHSVHIHHGGLYHMTFTMMICTKSHLHQITFTIVITSTPHHIYYGDLFQIIWRSHLHQITFTIVIRFAQIKFTTVICTRIHLQQ